MAEDWKSKKERRNYVRNGINDKIEREIKRKQKEAKQALRNQWIYKIKQLHEKGWSADKIYKLYASAMKQQLGFDPQRTIEHFTGETINKDEKQKCGTHSADEMEI